VVFWQIRRPPAADDLERLRQRARAGTWNALLGDARTPAAARTAWDAAAAADPVVVHARLEQAADGALRPVELRGGYGETAALEGQPLWTRLADPAALLRAVIRHGAKGLCRMRVAADGTPFTLGSALEYHFETPERMDAAVFEEVLRLVAAGGAVTTERVRDNLQHAFLIGVVTERGRVVADSSFKHPREAYIEAVLRQTGFDLRGFLERGYTSVRPEYRGLGIGTKLLEGLTARAQGRKFYSIIAEDNEATKTMARRNNTVQIGSFYSEKMGKPVGIWTAAEFAAGAGR
jgi:GNAT superfamily N-acetyltransferase